MPNAEKQPEPFNPVIVAPDGKPARPSPDSRCPVCGAGANERVPSCGFGDIHDVCNRCAFEFRE